MSVNLIKLVTPEYVPIREFDWTDDFSYHRVMTCKNHPLLRWTSKNVFSRSLFFSSGMQRDSDGAWIRECNCPLGDLIVIVSESRPPTR